MRVEFILCWEDRTWTTEFHETPWMQTEPEIMKWGFINLIQKPEYAKVVFMGVFNWPEPLVEE